MWQRPTADRCSASGAAFSTVGRRAQRRSVACPAVQAAAGAARTCSSPKCRAAGAARGRGSGPRRCRAPRRCRLLALAGVSKRTALSCRPPLPTCGSSPWLDGVFHQRLQQQRWHRQRGAARAGSVQLRGCSRVPMRTAHQRQVVAACASNSACQRVVVHARGIASVVRRKAIRWSSMAWACSRVRSRSARAGWPAC